MMMVQTAIHVTISQNPGLSPSELLSIVNETITKNIQMMSDDKYMTITVMATIEDGKFIFSGLHQDILIFRSKTKEIEIVETNGIWLGVSDNIQDFLKDDGFTLDKGDLILVFTDGIIESKKKQAPEQNWPW